LEEIVIDGKLS